MAAIHFLSGLDPVGTPLLRSTPLELDVWAAISMRADRIYEAAKRANG